MESLSEVGRLSPAGTRAARPGAWPWPTRPRWTGSSRQPNSPASGRSALQAEGPAAFGEPEVVAELKLTADQREQIRTIEEEALFGWMRGPRTNTTPGAQEKSANQRILAVLAEDQVRRWKATDRRAGEVSARPVRFAEGQDAALNAILE